jgi:hypothetical protein
VVTATKREQTLQRCRWPFRSPPAETLDRAKIRDIKDLASMVPFARGGPSIFAQTSFIIRFRQWR